MREQQPTVLAVPGAYVRQPAQPGPLRGALLQGAGVVRGDQDDLQGVGGVQRRELGQHRAGQPGEAFARARQAERADLAQSRGDRYGGQQAGAVRRGPVRGAEPHRERLGVTRTALPQPGAGAERGQQQRGGVRPGLGEHGGDEGRLRRVLARVRAAAAPCVRCRLPLLPSAGQPPGPRPDTAPLPPAGGLGERGAADGGALAGAGAGPGSLRCVAGRTDGGLRGRASVVRAAGGMPGGAGGCVTGGGACGVAGTSPGRGEGTRAGGPAVRVAVARSTAGRPARSGRGCLVPGVAVARVRRPLSRRDGTGRDDAVPVGEASEARVRRVLGRALPGHPPPLGRTGHVRPRGDPHRTPDGSVIVPLTPGRPALLRHRRNGAVPRPLSVGHGAVGARSCGGPPARCPWAGHARTGVVWRLLSGGGVIAGAGPPAHRLRSGAVCVGWACAGVVLRLLSGGCAGVGDRSGAGPAARRVSVGRRPAGAVLRLPSVGHMADVGLQARDPPAGTVHGPSVGRVGAGRPVAVGVSGGGRSRRGPAARRSPTARGQVRRAVGVTGLPPGRFRGPHARVRHRARVAGDRRVVRRTAGDVPRGPRPRHPDVSLPVRCRRRPRGGARRRRQAQGRLADAQQRARGQPDRAGTHAPAVEGGAVGGAEVGDRDAAVGGHRHRAVQTGDVRVVERYVGVRGAAYADLAAVQQMHPARVRTRDHMQPGRGVVQLGMRLGLTGRADGQHRAVDQRRLAQRAALGVEALVTGVQHRRARGTRRAVAAGDRRGQGGGDRGQSRARGRRDQHVAARGPLPRGGGGAQRVYDGQPDLHRRQRSLLRERPRQRGNEAAPRSPNRGLPPPSHAHVRPVLHASSHLPPTTRPPSGSK